MSNILQESILRYLNSFQFEDDPFILEMEKFAEHNNIPILNKSAAAFLELLVLIKKPTSVLEIGTAIGYSSIRIAKSLSKEGKLFTIEKSNENKKVAENNFVRAGYADKIRLLFGDALEIMPKLKKKFDLIFLDADKEDYTALFEYALPLLKKNGILFVDNLLWHGYAASDQVPDEYKETTDHIKKFNKIFSSQAELKTVILPVGDGIGIGLKL